MIRKMGIRGTPSCKLSVYLAMTDANISQTLWCSRIRPVPFTNIPDHAAFGHDTSIPVAP